MDSLSWVGTLHSGLSPLARDMIAQQVTDKLPEEAVGLLWEQPGVGVGVIALDNISEDPEHSYAISTAEMIRAFEVESGRDILSAISEGCSLTLWHSHPSGQVGPSRGDMREKLEGLQYMVVSVTEQGLLATLF